MKDLTLYNGTRILIIEFQDILPRRWGHPQDQAVKDIMNTCRSHYDVVLVLMSPSLGVSVLPKWMREYPLRTSQGAMGGCWIMEKAPDGMWIE